MFKNKDFPSISIFLVTARDEYTKEREYADKLDNKAGVFISAMLAIITLYIPIIPFSGIKNIYVNSDTPHIILTTIALCCLFSAIIIVVMAFYFLYKTFALKTFQRLDFEDLADENNLSFSRNLIEKGLLDVYVNCLRDNSKVNKNKSKALNKGLKFSIVSFILLSLSVISLKIITG